MARKLSVYFAAENTPPTKGYFVSIDDLSITVAEEYLRNYESIFSKIESGGSVVSAALASCVFNGIDILGSKVTIEVSLDDELNDIFSLFSKVVSIVFYTKAVDTTLNKPCIQHESTKNNENSEAEKVQDVEAIDTEEILIQEIAEVKLDPLSQSNLGIIPKEDLKLDSCIANENLEVSPTNKKWIKCYSPSDKSFYYYNSETQDTQWEEPQGEPIEEDEWSIAAAEKDIAAGISVYTGKPDEIVSNETSITTNLDCDNIISEFNNWADQLKFDTNCVNDFNNWANHDFNNFDHISPKSTKVNSTTPLASAPGIADFELGNIVVEGISPDIIAVPVYSNTNDSYDDDIHDSNSQVSSDASISSDDTDETFIPDSTMLTQLIEMGFSFEKSYKALKDNNNELSGAVASLVNNYSSSEMNASSIRSKGRKLFGRTKGRSPNRVSSSAAEPVVATAISIGLPNNDESTANNDYNTTNINNERIIPSNHRNLPLKTRLTRGINKAKNMFFK